MFISGNKMQTNATEVFIADVIACSHVSGTTMPIIRSSRVLYSGCCLWYFVVFKLLVWCGAEGYVSGLQDAAALSRSSRFASGQAPRYTAGRRLGGPHRRSRHFGEENST